jgi:hypothetical protein
MSRMGGRLTSILFRPKFLSASKLDRGASILARGLSWLGELGDIGDRVALTVSGSLVVRSLSTCKLFLFAAMEVRAEGGCEGTRSSRLDAILSAERFAGEASSMRILSTLMASLPKLKKEKKYCDS